MKHSRPSLAPLVYGMSLALGLIAMQAFANGIRISSQDAFASGRGEAFAATADNASALDHNPAGLAQIEGQQIRGGVYALDLDISYESPTGQKFTNRKDLQAIPELFYAYSSKALPLSFGLGLYSPYGLSSEWAQNTGFRTVATQGQLTYLTINPAVAWRVTSTFSLAAGLTINEASLDLQRGLVWPAQDFDNFRFKGDGWDVGYNLGLLWKPIEQISIGVAFRSPTTFNFDGRTQFHNNVPLPIPGGPVIPAFPEQQMDAHADFPFPLNAVFGVSYRPSPSWNLEFNADYTDWNRLGTVIVQQSGPFATLVPQDIALPLNWESSWYYEFGATRYLGKAWSVSAGYIFNENSMPSANYTPLVADLDRHFFTIGTGYKGTHFGFDAAYQFGYGPTRTVSGSAPSLLGQSADGQYEFFSHAVLLTATWRF